MSAPAGVSGGPAGVELSQQAALAVAAPAATAAAPATASSALDRWEMLSKTDTVTALKEVERELCAQTQSLNGALYAAAALSLLQLASNPREEFQDLYLKRGFDYLESGLKKHRDSPHLYYARARFHAHIDSFLNAACDNLTAAHHLQAPAAVDGPSGVSEMFGFKVGDIEGIGLKMKEKALNMLNNWLPRGERLRLDGISVSAAMEKFRQDVWAGKATAYINNVTATTLRDFNLVDDEKTTTAVFCRKILNENGVTPSLANKVRKFSLIFDPTALKNHIDEMAGHPTPNSNPPVSILSWNMRVSAAYHKPRELESWSDIIRPKVDYLADMIMSAVKQVSLAVIQEAPGDILGSAQELLSKRLSVKLPYNWENAACPTGSEAAMFVYDSQYFDLVEGFPLAFHSSSRRGRRSLRKLKSDDGEPPFKRPPVLAVFKKSSNPVFAPKFDGHLAVLSIHADRFKDDARRELSRIYKDVLPWVHQKVSSITSDEPIFSLVIGDFNLDLEEERERVDVDSLEDEADNKKKEKFAYTRLSIPPPSAGKPRSTNLSFLVSEPQVYDGAIFYSTRSSFVGECEVLSFLKEDETLFDELEGIPTLQRVSKVKDMEKIVAERESPALGKVVQFLKDLKDELKAFALNNYSDHKPLLVSIEEKSSPPQPSSSSQPPANDDVASTLSVLSDSRVPEPSTSLHCPPAPGDIQEARESDIALAMTATNTPSMRSS
jgi:hypothetical protein